MSRASSGDGTAVTYVVEAFDQGADESGTHYIEVSLENDEGKGLVVVVSLATKWAKLRGIDSTSGALHRHGSTVDLSRST